MNSIVWTTVGCLALSLVLHATRDDGAYGRREDIRVGPFETTAWAYDFAGDPGQERC